MYTTEHQEYPSKITPELQCTIEDLKSQGKRPILVPLEYREYFEGYLNNLYGNYYNRSDFDVICCDILKPPPSRCG